VDQSTQTPEDSRPDSTEIHQDTFRKVYFGQVSDPLYPSHPGPPENPYDELERAALEDPAAEESKGTETPSAVWRLVSLFLVAIAALGLVFLWRK